MLVLLTKGYQQSINKKGSSGDGLLFECVENKHFEQALDMSLQNEHMNTINNNDQNITLQSYQNIGMSKMCLGNFRSALTEFKVAVDTAKDVFQNASFKLELGSCHLLVKNASKAMQSLHSVLDDVGLGYVVDKFGLVTDLGIQRFTKKHSDKDDEVSNSESKNNPSLDCESAQSSSRGKPGYAIWDTGALVTQDSDDDSYNQKLGKYEKILTAAELVARSLNNIACVYVEVGKLEAAYVTLEEAKELILQIMKKMKRKCKKYREMSLDTIRTALTVCAMNIGYLQLRRENYVEAVNIFEEANYLVEENFGKEHESLAYILSQLSFAYLKVSFYDESAKVLQRLLTFQMASKTISHSPTFITLVKLALICVKMENFYVALGYLEEALQLQEQQQDHFYPVKNRIFSREKMEEFLWKLKYRMDPKTNPDELIVSWNSDQYKHIRSSLRQSSVNNSFGFGTDGDLEEFVNSNLEVPLTELIQDVLCVGPIGGNFVVLRNVVLMELDFQDEIEEDVESELEIYHDHEHKSEESDYCRRFDFSQGDYTVEIQFVDDKHNVQACEFAIKIGRQINVTVCDKFYLLELIHSAEEEIFYDELIDYVDNEEYEEAAQLYKKHVECLPKNAPGIPRINQILSLLYFYIHQYKLSLSYIESSIGAKHGNPQTREYCQFHQHAAITNLALGRYVEALGHFHEVLRVQRICLGQSHLSTAKTHQAIAATHFELEEYRAALLHIQACISCQIANVIDTSTNRHYAYLQCWMGVAQCRLGDYKIALSALNEALAVQEKIPKSKDTLPALLFTMGIMASANVLLENHNEALQIYTEMLRMLKGDFVSNHPQCELIVQKMNYVYLSKGLYQEAINNLKILQKFQIRNSFDESMMFRPLMDRTKMNINILERKKSEAVWI